MKNYKKILAVAIASAAVVTAGVSIPAVSNAAKAETATTTTSKSNKKSAAGKNDSNSNKSSSGKFNSGNNSQPGQPPQGNGQTHPEKPSGDNSAPGSQNSNSSNSSNSNSSNSNSNGQPSQPPHGNGNQPGGSQTKVTYKSATTFKKSATTKGKTYTSKKSGQNAVTATGKKVKVTLKNATIKKSGSSSGGDSDNFYGTNSAALAKSGAVLTIKNSTIKTTANGANGTFAYGGGTVRVNKGTYTTTGVGSPAIYCTSDTAVKNAKLVSKASEGIVIEGKNSVKLTNTSLTANNTKLNGQAKTYQSVMLYQSMSGDSENGTAKFSATGGSITNKHGSLFYVTNTTANISLNHVKITNSAKGNVLLKVAAGSWGNSGSNGGKVTFTANRQKLSGKITVDKVSSLTLKLTNKSTFKGTINSKKQTGTVKVTVNKGCTWTLTGDSYVTSLTNHGRINTNGHTLYVNGVAYKG